MAKERVWSGLAAAAAAAILVAWPGAACGGGGSAEREQIETAVRDLQRAFASEDSERVCALLSRDARKHVESMGHDPPGQPSGPCDFDVYMFYEGVQKARDWKKRTARGIRDVDVNGARATATIEFEDGQTASLPLVRERGAWRIDALYGGIPAGQQKDNY